MRLRNGKVCDMAANTAQTPVKPRPGAAAVNPFSPSILFWNAYDQISKTLLAAAPVQAPPLLRSPLLLEQDNDDIFDQTETEVRFRFDNMPPNTRVSTRGGGDPLQIRTRGGVKAGIGGALWKTKSPDDQKLNVTGPIFESGGGGGG